uniref:Uncharacterized protein n=1 Tax=Arundo donax TaxID=35708 RepID=A0A0A9EWF4_ARUDO
MDPSVCRLHPGVAVTGFCPTCLRDRLAGLQPPSSADLRRCKSSSYARSAAAHSHLEQQRRSCDLFHQEPIAVPVPEEGQEAAAVRRMEEHLRHQEPSRKSLGGLMGKKLQQWRRKNKLKKEPPMPPPERDAQPEPDGRRSCDVEPRASWSGTVPVFARLPLAMLSVEEDIPVVPRSDGQIPVEEDDCYYDNGVPGGCAQTRDYYLDSSSSSRRRRSLDRSTTSGRNSFSDATEPPRMMNANANARVSPAIAAEFYHAQSVLVHHQYCRDQGPNDLRLRDDFSGSFGSAFRDHTNNKGGVPANKPKKGIKGWNIWGLIQKKSSNRKPEADHGASSAAGGGEYPWPELRARGYNGQMLRCNSSISARSSFSGGTAMIGGSGRRSISGVEMHDVNGNGLERMRRDQVLLERNLSTRSSSYSRSGPPHPAHLDHPMGVQYQFGRPNNHNGMVSGNKGRSSKPSSLPRRSTLGLYSTDPIPRQ